MKFILLLISVSLFGQSAKYNDILPSVKGMTVGNNYCYFWFHNEVYSSAFNAGWDYEVACYDHTNNLILEFKKPGDILDSGYKFPGGSIRFIIKPNQDDPTKYDFSLSGEGPDDVTSPAPIVVTI